MIEQNLKEKLIDIVKKDVNEVIHDVIFSVLGETGLSSCKTITGIFKPMVELICCDLMNDVIALSAASYIYYYYYSNRVLIGIFMFISTCIIPCANVCLGEGDLTEFKPPSKADIKKAKEEKKKGKESEKEKRNKEREEKKSKKLEKKGSKTIPEDNGAFQMRKKK